MRNIHKEKTEKRELTLQWLQEEVDVMTPQMSKVMPPQMQKTGLPKVDVSGRLEMLEWCKGGKLVDMMSMNAITTGILLSSAFHDVAQASNVVSCMPIIADGSMVPSSSRTAEFGFMWCSCLHGPHLAAA